MRKKREWLALEEMRKGMISNQKRPEKRYCGSWENLPDLVLEQIFQYLPYKVQNFNYCLEHTKIRSYL